MIEHEIARPEGWMSLVSAISALIGALFFFSSAVGLVRLPDFFTRTHSPTKAATLGLFFLGIASFLENIQSGQTFWLADVLLVVFVFLTAPVSAQALMSAASARGVTQYERTTGDPPGREIEHVEESGELAAGLAAEQAGEGEPEAG